jgi:hypothetical protein
MPISICVMTWNPTNERMPVRAAREEFRAQPRDRGVMTCPRTRNHNTQHTTTTSWFRHARSQRSQIALTRLGDVVLYHTQARRPRSAAHRYKTSCLYLYYCRSGFFSRGTLFLALGGLCRAAAEGSALRLQTRRMMPRCRSPHFRSSPGVGCMYCKTCSRPCLLGSTYFGCDGGQWH